MLFAAQKYFLAEVVIAKKDKELQSSGKAPDNTRIVIGSIVRVAGVSGFGEVLSLRDNQGQVLVAIGSVKLKVDYSKLSLSSNIMFSSSKSPQNSKRHSKQDLSGEISVDLHGMNVAQALSVVEEQLNQALLTGKARLIIVHGKGSGKLMSAVREYLSSSKHVSSFRADRDNSGVTIAEI